MTASPAPLQVPLRNIAIWRGDDVPPVVWVFGDAGMPEFFDGATFLLIVQWGVKPAAGAPCRGPLLTTGEFTLSSEDETLAVDAAEQTVSWTPTLSEFTAIPFGAPVRYELKRIIAGKARTAVWGEVRIGSGLLRTPGEPPGPIGQSYTDIRIATLRSELLAAIADVGPGQGGSSNRTETVLTAAVALSGHKAVRGTPIGAAYASATYASHLGSVVGVTTGAAAAGEDATIISSGAINEPSWSWAPGPVWLGLDGNLTQIPPAGAFVQQIGVAVGSTRLIVSLGPPIRTL